MIISNKGLEADRGFYFLSYNVYIANVLTLGGGGPRLNRATENLESLKTKSKFTLILD